MRALLLGDGLLRTAGRSLARDRLAALTLTLTATMAVLLFQTLQHVPGGAAVVERLGVVRASLPLWESLLRTPLSLFVPAPDLPVWGAAVQVLLVFGLAELTIGRCATLAVAYAGTLAGTLYARHAVHAGARGADSLFSLPWSDALVRDTGPSAAVVALAVYIAWRYRAWLTGAAIVLAMVLEQALFPNLAGAEHLAAILCTLVLAGGGELVARRLVRTADAWRPLLSLR
ncbi:hypothetical protein ACEZCY_32060 [Streptacidiphilus sp. N1-12]|uniref:Integral membrane protein n=2 Tax=Streptacidiphilus alkalitolerans TaxID=3342712 RepID=A0ABV6VJ86_9ACTN